MLLLDPWIPRSCSPRALSMNSCLKCCAPFGEDYLKNNAHITPTTINAPIPMPAVLNSALRAWATPRPLVPAPACGLPSTGSAIAAVTAVVAGAAFAGGPPLNESGASFSNAASAATTCSGGGGVLVIGPDAGGGTSPPLEGAESATGADVVPSARREPLSGRTVSMSAASPRFASIPALEYTTNHRDGASVIRETGNRTFARA